jgi:hypothetical protein
MGSFIQDMFGSPDIPEQSKNPGWIDNAASDIYNRANTISQTPYTPYNGNMVAPLTQNQQLAAQNARANLGRFANTYGQINGLLDQTGQQYNKQFTPTNTTTQMFPQANINSYMNPYLSAAMQPQLDAINQDYAQRQNQANSQAAGSGNFGGSRQALLNAQLTKQQQDQLNGVRNQGYNTAFNNAANLFQNDQTRDLQNQQFNAGQAANAFNTNYGIFQNNQQALTNKANQLENLVNLQRNISTQTNNDLMNTGAVGQQYNQNVLTNAYNQFQQQQNYPKDQLSWLANLLNNSPSKGAVAAPAQEGNSGVGNMIGTGLKIAAFSDVMLKENIIKTGEKDGINIYDFNYKNDPKRYRGVMAQEVEHLPDTVFFDESGYRKVDYSKLPIRFEQII